MINLDDGDIILLPRHIQNYSDAKSLEPHWGYVSRVIPCTNDAGSCAYLDNVYHAHDLGMMYIGIIWATIIGILFIWGLARFLSQKSVELNTNAGIVEVEKHQQTSKTFSTIQRYRSAFTAEFRKRFLPDGPRFIFGRTSRLQIVILGILAGYLFIWSFLGFSWKTYITPVKNKPSFQNTRTTLGPWSDRIGILAFGMLPFSILLSSRESILSIITGIPYHHFNFLHRWLGYIILIQSILHTIGWTIVEAKLYQPQPSTAQEWISQPYMIWGCIAVIVLTIMWLLTWPSIIKRTGYEFFRKAHYIMAMLFIGSCWGHWAHLKCFLIPSILLWVIDRFARLTRTFLMHYNFFETENGKISTGFHSTKANTEVFEDFQGGHVIRLDFDQKQNNVWQIGQHFFLTFPQLSIWQAHPFTPFSFPFLTPQGKVRHSYLFRAKSGQTKKLSDLIKMKNDVSSTTDVILTGPYGASITKDLSPNENVMCIAGGTGITFVLPVLLQIAKYPTINQRKVSLLWVIRHSEDVEWIRPELELIEKVEGIEINIQSTRDVPSTPRSSNEKEEKEIQEFTTKSGSRPNLNQSILSFLESNINPTTIFASGPGEMLSELRSIVGKCNNGKQILRGENQANVRFISDNRLEW